MRVLARKRVRPARGRKDARRGQRPRATARRLPTADIRRPSPSTSARGYASASRARFLRRATRRSCESDSGSSLALSNGADVADRSLLRLLLDRLHLVRRPPAQIALPLRGEAESIHAPVLV